MTTRPMTSTRLVLASHPTALPHFAQVVQAHGVHDSRSQARVLGSDTQPDSAVLKIDSGVDAGKGKLGLALRPLQPQDRHEAGLESGLRVEHAAGAAALAGVQTGDVLVAIKATRVA